MTTTGWLKTLDGHDVYTDDGEWYWSNAAQGWFHAPNLLTSVPAPPVGVRVRNEVHRLTHDWPKWHYVFDLKWQVGILNRLWWVICMTALVYMWVWKYLIQWGPVETLKGFLAFFVGAMPQYQQPGQDPPLWAQNVSEERSYMALWVVVYLVITVACIWYSLYIGVVANFDSHKATAMVAAVAVPIWLSHMKESRIREAVEAARRAGGP